MPHPRGRRDRVGKRQALDPTRIAKGGMRTVATEEDAQCCGYP